MFSVVISLYNKAHTIERTLQSVLKQTFTDFEIIIVNDGSTDNGVETIQKHASDLRIHIINQENQGVSVARNRGIKESKFDYIAFLDGDDEWHPDFLLKVKEAIEKYPNAGFYGTSSIHRDFITGKETDSTIDKFRNKLVKVDCFKTPKALAHTSAIVVKKSILYKIDTEYNGFPVGMRVCEDWACFFRIALITDYIYIGIPLGIRNNNVEGQITRSSDEQKKTLYNDVIRYYNLIYKFWLSNSSSNHHFISFIRYELRHRFKCLILRNDRDIIDLIISNLEKGLLHPYEVYLYKNPRMQKMAIFLINIKKVYPKISTIFNNWRQSD